MSDAVNGAHVAETRRTFTLLCRVEISIQSPPARIWSLLTDAKNFHRWNSTITAIEGEIRAGQRIRIHVPGTNRTFTPSISNVVPDTRMTWSGGFAPLFTGVRSFELTPQPDRSTIFVMQERFSGLMLPIVRRSMPDFGPVFDALCCRSETRSRTNPRIGRLLTDASGTLEPVDGSLDRDRLTIVFEGQRLAFTRRH